jgi:PAS domain S-box-containing protein
MNALARLPDEALADAGIGTWHWQVPDDLVRFDPSWWQCLGYVPAELPDSGSLWLRFVHRHDWRQLLRLRVRGRMAKLDGVRLDCRFRTREGTWAWARLCGRACAGADEPATAYAGIVSDISREKAIERRYRGMVGRPFQFSGLLAPDGEVLETSESSLQASGYRVDQVIGHKYWDAPFFRNSPLVQELLRCGVECAVRGELVRIELPSSAADGTVSVVDFSLMPLYDDDGRVVNLVPEGRDVTHLAIVRDELAQAEDRLSHATAAANIGLWDWNPVTDEAWFNSQFHTMLGYEPGELPPVGRTFLDFTHPDDQELGRAAIVDHVQGPGRGHRVEMRMRCKDGSWRWILSVGRVVRRGPDGFATRIAGLHVDITERKELERQLATARRLESIGRLAAGLAHEINTPIQFVQDSVYFIDDAVRELLESLPQGGAGIPSLAYCRDNLPQAVARARAGLERVSSIVRSMRDFAHSDATDMAFADINHAIAATLAVTRHEYRDVADVATELDRVPLVKCHAGQINQVLANLIVNAAHAIADVVGASGERGCITVRTWQDGDGVCISVEDTGPGIPESVRDRVFEPFFTTKGVGHGAGQGLSVARAIVVGQHRGDLNFTTVMGSGTRFLVRLPLDSTVAGGVAEVA